MNIPCDRDNDSQQATFKDTELQLFADLLSQNHNSCVKQTKKDIRMTQLNTLDQEFDNVLRGNRS